MESYAAQYKRPHSGWCSAANCLNQRGTSSGISFFMFPASPERCRTWAINAGRLDLEKRAAQDSKTLRKNNALCEEHFHRDQFMCPAEKGVLNKRKRLMPKAIPTLFGLEATKVAAGNMTNVEGSEALTTVNNKLSIGEQLIEALMAPERNTSMDPDILLSDLAASRKPDPDLGPYHIMKAVADSGDTYLAVPLLSLQTNGSSSDKIVLSEIVAGDCLECAEPLRSDPSEVAKLKHLVKKKIQCIQRLKNRVQTLKAIKKKYEKPEGIMKLASNYLEDEDLAVLASKLQSSTKRKRHILVEQDEQYNVES